VVGACWYIVSESKSAVGREHDKPNFLRAATAVSKAWHAEMNRTSDYSIMHSSSTNSALRDSDNIRQLKRAPKVRV
jgi:hypothetical protein